MGVDVWKRSCELNGACCAVTAVSTGAIATGACVKPGADMSTRFKHFMDYLNALSGCGKVGFSQPTYLCEFETAWRNNVLMYFMEGARC